MGITATRVWKELPTKGDKTQEITKILQGPGETFQDFVAHLLHHMGGTFGDPELSTLLVKQLDLLCATPGSAGLDLSPSTQYALIPEMGTQTIPTGVYGPITEGTIGLILGKNSLTLKGLQIHPGVIDQDYMGELKILSQAPQTFVAIAPTHKIAH
jgi:hypothetical protein